MSSVCISPMSSSSTVTRKPLVWLLLLTCGLAVGCNGSRQEGESGSGENDSSDGKKPTVAYVTNGIASFWTIAEAEAHKAGEDFNANVEVRMPAADGAVANQKRMIEELLTIGVDGIAVSPIDPDNQTDILNQAAANTHLITHDSDAPKSNREAYVGMSNYDAGRLCGELVKEAMPEGGTIMIFVGRIEQLNAKQRRQGLIDEVLNRSHDPERFDDPGQPIEGEKYTFLGTRTDNFDFGAAKTQAEDTLAAYPDIDCMVGLFAYNPPNIIEALKGANKLGKVTLIGFDEADETLQAIEDGYCYGTVVQNPYMYGYESVRILTALAKGDESALPEDGFLNIEARKITKGNVTPFWDELKRLTGNESTPESSATDSGAEDSPDPNGEADANLEPVVTEDEPEGTPAELEKE